MGRKKIAIRKIEDKQQRNITFHKRKIGLLKKAYQLSQLCGLQVFLVFNDPQGNVIQFKTDETTLLEVQDKKRFLLTPRDYPRFVTRNKNQVQVPPRDLPLTPLHLIQDFYQLEEPLASRYSARSQVFFPPPRRRP